MADETVVKIKRERGYLLNVSKGDPIKIDEEEIPLIMQAVQAGSPVVLKQGVLLNPNMGVTITPDKARNDDYVHMVKMGSERHVQRGMQPLASLIDKQAILKVIGSGAPQLGAAQKRLK